MEEKSSFTPVDLKLSIAKPVGAKWLIELYDYFKTKPKIMMNGFHSARITDFMKDLLSYMTVQSYNIITKVKHHVCMCY